MPQGANPLVHGDLSSLQGKKIVRAYSSLQNLSVEFEAGVALSLEAVNDEGDFLIKVAVIDARELVPATEAVCSVDWSWIYGAKVKSVGASSQIVRLELDPAGPLTVSVNLWQGSPFLSFQPYKAPR